MPPSPDAAPPLNPAHTWHLTFGTYAARLHNDPRPTVDRRHNLVGTPFPPPDPDRQQPPTSAPIRLTYEHCSHIEQTIPQLCTRGGWTYHTCAAPFELHPHEPGRVGPAAPNPLPNPPPNPAQYGNHVHILLAATAHIHGKQIRKWIKRWLSESLTQTFGPPPSRWWAEGGSTKPVTSERYLLNVARYINNQRTTDISALTPHHP